MHRFIWDLHLPPPKTDQFSFPIAAGPHDTPRRPVGPWVLPGRYTVTLTAEGTRVNHPLVVRMDPRVKTSREALEQQFTLSMQVYEAIDRVFARVPPTSAPPAPFTEPTDPMRRLHADLLTVYDALQEVDAAPTQAVRRTVDELVKLVDTCCGR